MSEETESYKQIFKSTSIIGGSQVITILVGIVRTKIAALLLGPFGYGIVSSLQATIDMMRQATGLGLNFSAVREISLGDAVEHPSVLSRIVTILRRWALYTGLLGMLVTVALCYPLSRYAFDSPDYAVHIALVSVVLLITSISSAQVAVLQGTRRLRQMALASVWGSVAGIVIVVPLYYFFGLSGIVPGLILTAGAALLISWHYIRRLKIGKTPMTLTQTLRGGIGMAKLGFFIVMTGFVVALIMYTVRAFIVRQLGLDAVGWFQSAWSVSNVYFGIVLTAMGADFFPRLSTVHNDRIESNKLINQQLRMVLLIIAPLLVVMIACAPWVVRLLYSSQFEEAIPLLRWQLAGGIFTIVAWCLGVMYLAKNKGHLALLTESLWGLLYLVFILGTWEKLGFISLGVGYLVASVIKMFVTLWIVRRLGGFRFTVKSLKDLIILTTLVLMALASVVWLSGWIQVVLNGILLATAGIYSYRRFNTIINIQEIVTKIFRRK